MDEECAARNGSQINQVCGGDTKLQCKPAENRLSRRIVGGDIEHICLWNPDVDGIGSQTAQQKQHQRVQIAG